MSEVDTCFFCGTGVPEGRQCNCPGAKSARKNKGRPEGDSPATTFTSQNDVVDLEDDYDD